MAHVDIRSFTSFSPETSRLNISMCVLTTRDYPWSKITSASASPEIVSLSRECAVAETDFVYTILIFHHHNFPNFFFCLSLDYPTSLSPAVFIPLLQLNSAVELNPHKWHKSEDPKLKVAGVGGGSKLLLCYPTAKGERDKEERDGWITHVSSDSGYLSQAPCLLAWSRLEPSEASSLPLVHVNHDFHWTRSTLLR